VKKKYIVRDFHYNPQTIQHGKEEKQKMISSKEQQKSKLTLWCKTNFTEAFTAWIHLKAIRVFVESTLRFGLPAHFTAILIQSRKKDDKRVRTGLGDIFQHLGSKLLEGEEEGVGEAFYPYVSLTISLEFRQI